jgi:hypothetical protein
MVAECQALQTLGLCTPEGRIQRMGRSLTLRTREAPILANHAASLSAVCLQCRSAAIDPADDRRFQIVAFWAV